MDESIKQLLKEKSKPSRYPVRLQKAIKASIDLTKEVREVRKKILEKYAAGYFTGESDPARPINMVMRAIQILVPYLVADNPKAMISPDGKPELKPFADTLERLINKRMRRMNLYLVLRKAVYNSLWSTGITKTGLCSDDEMDYNGERVPKYKMYCDTVDFEDFVFDPTARCIEEAEFLGNGYLIAMDELRDSGKFKNYDEVRITAKLWGDTSPESASKNLQDFKFRELHEYAYVYDVYLPEKKIVATLPRDGEGKKYMRTVDWTGPESGPYDLLGYNFFPNSILPIPPMFVMLDQDEQLNKMARKMFRQSSRDKTVLAYDGGAEKDASRITGASDGESVRVESIDRVKEIHFGGVNQDIWPVIQWLRGNIGEVNNIDILSQGAGSKTLGQDQLIMSNAMKTADDMVWRVHHFAKSIMEKLAQFDWEDPLLQETVVKQVGDLSLSVEVSHDNLEGEMFDYWFDVQPYSMQRMSPEMKFQKRMQLVSGVILPTLQLGTQQGAQLNVPELVKRCAKDIDEDINGLYLTAPTANATPDAYQPMAGVERRPATGQADDRQGTNGANQQANLNRNQAQAFQMSSAST